MPIYEYSCKKCGEDIEILHKVDEKPGEPCPACGSRALARKISAAGFRLAGGGWYETDFKKNGQKNLKGDKSDTKKDSKADATACKPTGCEKPGCAAKAA
jgi:putative FmdB family regulatory protein